MTPIGVVLLVLLFLVLILLTVIFFRRIRSPRLSPLSSREHKPYIDKRIYQSVDMVAMNVIHRPEESCRQFLGFFDALEEELGEESEEFLKRLFGKAYPSFRSMMWYMRSCDPTHAYMINKNARILRKHLSSILPQRPS